MGGIKWVIMREDANQRETEVDETYSKHDAEQKLKKHRESDPYSYYYIETR